MTTGAQPFAAEQLLEQISTLNVRITSVAGLSQATEANLNVVQGQVNSMSTSLAGAGSNVFAPSSEASSFAQGMTNMKAQMDIMTAGNRREGDCHCVHVTYLHDRLVDLEALVSRMRTGGHQGRDTQADTGRGAHGAGGTVGLGPEAGPQQAAPPSEWNMFSFLR